MHKIIATILFASLAVVVLAAQQASDPVLLDHVQKDHSLFHESPQRTPTLEDRVLRSGSNVHLQKSGLRFISSEFEPARLGTREAAEGFLAQALKGSDLVLVGSLVEQVSALSEDKRAVFTEAGFRVDAVLAQKPEGVVQTGERIYVAREGGRVLLAGHEISVDIADFPAFRTGQTYLLFLRKAENADSYRIRAQDAFWHQDGALESLFHPHPVPAYWKSWESFVQAVRERGAALE